jgi:hypothetical protein
VTELARLRLKRLWGRLLSPYPKLTEDEVHVFHENFLMAVRETVLTVFRNFSRTVTKSITFSYRIIILPDNYRFSDKIRTFVKPDLMK